MIVWLLVLLLLMIFIYVVYQMNFISTEREDEFDDEEHFTFKL